MAFKGDDFVLTKKKRKFGQILLTVLLDVLLAGVILTTFAYFHHVLPALKSASVSREPLPAEPSVQEPVQKPEEEKLDVPEQEPAEPQETDSAEQTEQQPEEPDTRTEWQKKFEEHFSDTVISTENCYKSPNVSIEVQTITVGEGNAQNTYHVADIYIASIDNFAAHTANNELAYFSTQDALEMDMEANALISMTGDFYSYQQSGLLVRNGQVYMDDYTFCDICVMYYDGTVETHLKGTYDNDEILARNPYQIWNFGPQLLDENGKAMTTFNTSNTVAQANPRSAFGYYEPGHYCFVVVDGRQPGYSVGMYLPDLAAVFEELGCTAAYNLDGGGSALMMFNHERYSQQSNGGDRALGDILVIRETEAAQ